MFTLKLKKNTKFGNANKAVERKKQKDSLSSFVSKKVWVRKVIIKKRGSIAKVYTVVKVKGDVDNIMAYEKAMKENGFKLARLARVVF